jgi:hypothetical protein
MAVFAIGRNDGIVGSERRHRTDGDRFFSDIQMEKATNFPTAVQLGTLFLKTAYAQHLVQQP